MSKKILGYCANCCKSVEFEDLATVQLREGIGKPWGKPREVCFYCRVKLGGAYFRYVKQYDPKKKKSVRIVPN